MQLFLLSIIAICYLIFFLKWAKMLTQTLVHNVNAVALTLQFSRNQIDSNHERTALTNLRLKNSYTLLRTRVVNERHSFISPFMVLIGTSMFLLVSIIARYKRFPLISFLTTTNVVKQLSNWGPKGSRVIIFIRARVLLFCRRPYREMPFNLSAINFFYALSN